MAAIPLSSTKHDVSIAAPVPVVYDIIRDVTRWPQRFDPTLHVEYHERGSRSELIQVWALANGEVKTWTSRRNLDPAGHRIRFRQQVSQPPVATMSGEWIFERTSPDTTRVIFEHEFSAVDNDPAAIAWITEAVDRNTTAELAGLKATAEQAEAAGELTFSFTDSLAIAGEASDVYDFLRDAARWPDRLPHVASLDLREEGQGIQLMAMSTRTSDGAAHDTYSIRICLPPDRIVYKQTRAPRLMNAHTGCWTLAATPSGTRATSLHAVTINRAAVTDVLGNGASLVDARQFVRDALGANSRTTLAYARDYAEQIRNGRQR